MTNTLTDTEFTQLGEQMKDVWNEAADDASVWNRFHGEMMLRNMCVRWSLDEDGSVRLVLEEHESTLDAFRSAQQNDGSVAPVRAVGWGWTKKGWVAG